MEYQNESHSSALKKIASKFDRSKFRALHETMSFNDYVEKVYANPRLISTAFQRIYDMIMSFGSYEFEKYRKVLTHYNFFDDEDIPIYGLEETLDSLVKFIRGAAGNYGTEKRVLLLHGPVGSAKSTIARCFKKGLEKYTRTDAGALYTFKWVNLPTGEDGLYGQKEDLCPMHEEPLRLVAKEDRQQIVEELTEVLREQGGKYRLKCEGDLCPRCKKFMEELLTRYDGDWEKVVTEHIRVVRLVMSESDRVGIGTFQPKDEKNQDSTELTGDINFGKLPQYGSDSDSRAFNFDGEFCVANRGMCEFIEMLKLAQEFLYDLLGASQEKQIKPKKFPQVAVDEFLLGHTNGPEFDKLKSNQYMEALKDRTNVVNVPYLTKWSDEIKILDHDYNERTVPQHIAPHTKEIAALWTVLTRLDLEDSKDNKLDPIKKVKLYNGEVLPGYTEDSIKEAS